MAIQYALHFSSLEDSLAIMRLIVAHLRSEDKTLEGEERGIEGASYDTRYYDIGIGPLPDHYRALLREGLDIQVNQEVAFWVNKFEDSLEAKFSMARVVALVLARCEGDVAFVFNGDWVLLRRRRGQLVLNQDVEFWEPERLAVLQTAYEIAPLPMMI